MKKFCMILGGLVLVTLFQNCSKVQYSSLDDDLSAKALDSDTGVIDDGRDPGDDGSSGPRDPGDDNPQEEVVTGNNPQDYDYCKILDEDRTITAGTQDYSFLNQNGAIEVSSAKAVVISSNNGSVRIENAASLDISGVRGSVQAKALQISKISANNGAVCVVADSVGPVSNIDGTFKVAAKEVESISNITGMVKIYGAKVQSIVGIKNVCLYEGASVVSSSNANIRKCD